MHVQIEEEIYDLFLWRKADFEFIADQIPEELVIDLSGHKLGDTIRMSEITLPEGAHPTITDRDFVIASIKTSSAAMSEAADEAADAAAAEEAAAEAPAEEASEEAATEESSEG